MVLHMKSQRNLLYAGVAALPWFTFWVVLLDVLRPEYDYRYKAVSELGVLGAPHMVWMNVLGFVGTGLLLAAFALGYKSLKSPRSPGYLPLLVTALLFMGTAIPGQMTEGLDPDPNYTSTITIIHLFFSLTSFIAWLIAHFSIIRHAAKPLRRLSAITMLVVVGLFVASASGALSGMPGLVQRINFGIFLGWYAIAALLLLKTTRRDA